VHALSLSLCLSLSLSLSLSPSSINRSACIRFRCILRLTDTCNILSRPQSMPLPAPWQPLPPEASGKSSAPAATARPDTAPAVGGARPGGAQMNPQTLTRLIVDNSDVPLNGAAAAHPAAGIPVKPYDNTGGSPTVILGDRRCKTAAAGGGRCASSYVPNTAGLRFINAETLDRTLDPKP